MLLAGLAHVCLSKLAQRGCRSGPGRRCHRYSTDFLQKRVSKMWFLQKIQKITRRITKLCLDAAKGSQNMILEQSWCQKGAKGPNWVPKRTKSIKTPPGCTKEGAKATKGLPKRSLAAKNEEIMTFWFKINKTCFFLAWRAEARRTTTQKIKTSWFLPQNQ